MAVPSYQNELFSAKQKAAGRLVIAAFGDAQKQVELSPAAKEMLKKGDFSPPGSRKMIKK